MANPNLVEVEIPTNEQELATLAIEKLIELMEAKGLEGYEPQEANLETIMIRVIAVMASSASQIASVVPLAILRKFGEEFIKLAFNEGARAQATTKWTIIEDELAVRTIEAGTAIEIAGLGFVTVNETEIPAKATTANILVEAVEHGEEYNNITGVAEQVNPLDWVTEVQFIGETSGGSNPESNEEYLVRLVGALKLQAPRPITAANYAEFVRDVPESVIGSGVRVGRATSIDGYDAETAEENVERCVTTFVTNVNGEKLSVPQMEAIETWLRGFREINFLAFVREPSYHEVYITFKVHVLPEYNPEAVVTEVKEKLLKEISPIAWEQSRTGYSPFFPGFWLNQKPSKLRYNYVIGLIESIPGVAYVFPGAEGLKIGLSETPTETVDITLTGPAPLPQTKLAHLLGTSE